MHLYEMNLVAQVSIFLNNTCLKHSENIVSTSKAVTASM